jgi:hypothetical protein
MKSNYTNQPTTYPPSQQDSAKTVEALAQPKPTEGLRINHPCENLHQYKSFKEMLILNKSKYKTGRKKTSKMKPQKRRNCSEFSMRL